jgi:ferredoxin-type protein NapH
MEQGQVFNILGLVYALVTTSVAFLLLRTGRMTMNRATLIALLTTAVGFLLTAPLIPIQMQSMVLGNVDDPMPLPIQMVIVGLLILTAMFVGRIFCGYACPIGAIQELVHRIPGKKIIFRWKGAWAVHALFVLVFFVGGGLSFSLLGWLGVRQFFHLDLLTVPFFIFSGLAILAVFIYRPFCRWICPFGFFSRLLAGRSIMVMRRRETCNSCHACEKRCPVGDAMERADGGSCFLCVRCVDKCKRDAIGFSRRR